MTKIMEPNEQISQLEILFIFKMYNSTDYVVEISSIYLLEISKLQEIENHCDSDLWLFECDNVNIDVGKPKIRVK